MLQLCQIYACANGTLGLNLSRAPWDPYPWVSGVSQDSNAQRAGIRMGDTVLELNGCDVLGMKISELALHLREHWQSGAEYVSMVVWRNKVEQSDASSSSTSSAATSSDVSEYEPADGINQQSLQKFATCLQHIAQLLECPVCLEVIKPPGWQCCNGHVLCNTCRSRSEKCPVCRVPLGPRGRCLLSDKLFTLLAESFPCDGVKTNNSNNNNSNNSKSNNMNKRCANPSETNKCTTEYHNHPKMAFSGNKLFEAKEMLKKTKYARQTNKLNEATVVDVDDVSAKISNTKTQMPKGNEQQQQQQTRQGQQEHQGQVNGGDGGSGAAEGNIKNGQQNLEIQREVNKSNFLNCAQFSDCTKQTSAVIATAIASGSNNTNSNNNNYNNNNNNNNNNSDKNEDNDKLLVKLKLKSSKKSSQITGQDQDELHNDEVANINNGMPTTTVTTTIAKQQQQQQYQNYHCPTGKSCCSYVQTFLNAGQSEFDGFRDANKLSTTSNNQENAKRTTTITTTMTAIQDVDNNIAEEQQENVRVAKSSEAEIVEAAAAAATAVSLAKSTNDVSLSCMTQAWRPRNRCDTGRFCCRGMQQGRHNCSCDANKATAIKAPAENQQQKEKLIVLTAKEAQAEQSIKAYNKLPTPTPTPPTRLQFGFHDEWQLLQHLTVSHRLAVMHFYGKYGERLHVPCCRSAVGQQRTIACLNLRAERRTSVGVIQTIGQVQRFFLAVIPLSDNAAGTEVTTTAATKATEKYAIFLWQITNENGNGNANEGNSFETIIAPQRTAIKWFGCAQPLTKSWNEIRNAGHFLTHHVMPGIDDDIFEIVVKMKNH